MGQPLSHASPCCGAQNDNHDVTLQLQLDQLQHQLLQKEEALNKYKALNKQREMEEDMNTIDEYKQKNLHHPLSKEKEPSDGNKIRHQYEELLGECNQYKHENTKLKRTQDELQRKLTELTIIADDIESKSPLPTQPLTDPNDRLQHIMLTLSQTKLANESLKPHINGRISPLHNTTDTTGLSMLLPSEKDMNQAIVCDRAQSNPTPIIVKSMLTRYKTNQIMLTTTSCTSPEDAEADDDDESMTSDLETDEEMEIAQAKEAQTKQQEQDDEIIAMQKQMKELKKSSDPDGQSDSASDKKQTKEPHLLRCGTEREWDRDVVIQQKKEMEGAMAALVESTVESQLRLSHIHELPKGT